MAAAEVQPRWQRDAIPLTAPRVNARAFAASATLIDLADSSLATRHAKLRREWQKYAWMYFKQLGLVHFAHDYASNCVSRVRLYPGFRAKPGDPPVPLDMLDDPEFELPDGADLDAARACVEQMEYLDESAEGGLSAIVGDLALNIALAGEGFLHGFQDDDSATGERYVIRSVSELKAENGGWYLYEAGSDSPFGDELEEKGDVVGRIWRSDREFRDLADAPMRALLDDCDNLLALKRVLLAATYSRAHGGVLRVPSELQFPQALDPEQQAADSVMGTINRAISSAIADPSSVSTVAPVEISGPAAFLKELTLLDLGRGYGKELLEQANEVSQTIATGLDLPNEVITGLGDVNHWGAWQIDEQTYKAHIEPLLLICVRGLQVAYLWPKLRALGITDNLSRYVIGHDESDLIGHPNQFENAKSVHDAYALSDDALRRYGGFSDEDKPDEDEIAERIYIAQQLKVTIREAGTLTTGEVQPESTLELKPGEPLPPETGTGAAPGPSTAKKGPPPPAAPGEKQTPPLAASAAQPLRYLGARLAEIDRDLATRIHTLADQALHRALERAGAKLRVELGRKDRKLAASLRKVPTEDLGRKLGRETVQAWGLRENELIDGQLGKLEGDYRKLTRRALAASLIAARGGQDVFPEHEIEAKQQEAEPHIAAGFALLAAGIGVLAHEQLFAEKPGAPPQGEADLTTSVPFGMVRDSLGLAGGGAASAAAGQPPAGVALGPIVTTALRQELAIFPASFQWVYGYPDREFPPHADLEGVEFSGWEDDVLANNDSFPASPYFRPGDHQGCLCSYMPMFASDRPIDEPAPEEG